MPIFNVPIEGTIVMVAETAEEARNKARDLLISGESFSDEGPVYRPEHGASGLIGASSDHSFIKCSL